MIWALLAAFLRNRALWVQAVMVGACTGLFVAAGSLGGSRAVSPGSGTFVVLVIALVAGGAYYGAQRRQPRGRGQAQPRGPRVDVAFIAVWIALVVTAIRTLVVGGGPRVAVFAIVPLVLLAEPALAGVRALSGRNAASSREHSAAAVTDPASPRSRA
jgi:hypothetical protein